MMDDKRKQPRWWEHLKALFGGYFWLPCPLCGEYFGGQEDGGTLATSPSGGVCVCANCKDVADRKTLLVYRSRGIWSGLERRAEELGLSQWPLSDTGIPLPKTRKELNLD